MRDDSWKGEDLIRNVPRSPYQGNGAPPGWARLLVEPKPKVRAPRPRCQAPGCSVELRHSNTSGVCREHRHAAGACSCLICRRGQP